MTGQINEQQYQQAKSRGIMLLSAHFAGGDLGNVARQEIVEMLPGVDPDSSGFAELWTLIGVLVSWSAADVEAAAERGNTTPLEQVAEFAEFLRDTD